jgi:hypothetical protein
MEKQFIMKRTPEKGGKKVEGDELQDSIQKNQPNPTRHKKNVAFFPRPKIN